MRANVARLRACVCVAFRTSLAFSRRLWMDQYRGNRVDGRLSYVPERKRNIILQRKTSSVLSGINRP